jgi:RND family efflux transporter MFP subunit
MRALTSRLSVASALAVLAAVSPGCGPAIGSAPAQTAGKAPVARVNVVRPERGTIRRTTEQPGQIEAAETTEIHAKIAGYVKGVAVDIGDAVKGGQTLAELHVPEMEAELAQKRALVDQAESEQAQAEAAVAESRAGITSAEAKLTEVKAAIRRTEADVARWQAEFARIAQLVRESAVTGSLRDETQSKLEAAQAARDEVTAQVRSAEAAVAESRAHLVKAEADVKAAASRVEVAEAEARRVESLLGYARIDAPFDGVITRRGIDTGHLTVPGGQDDPLFVLERVDHVTVSVGVPEADAPLVGRGDTAVIRLPTLGGRAYEGKVTRTSYSLDAATRTLRAEIDLPNPDDLLRPGLYAYTSIVAEEHTDALTLPAAAVFRDGGKAYCVVVADGRARRREIQTGLGDASRVEVASGLDGRELIVAARADTVAAGQPVEPVEAKPSPGKP